MCPVSGVSERARRWGHLPAPTANAAAMVAAEMHSTFPAAGYRIHATLGNASWETIAPTGRVMLWIAW